MIRNTAIILMAWIAVYSSVHSLEVFRIFSPFPNVLKPKPSFVVQTGCKIPGMQIAFEECSGFQLHIGSRKSQQVSNKRVGECDRNTKRHNR